MKELTAENKLELISLVNNGFVNTSETKTVIQEVSNLQHCMINNIINPKKVRNTNDLSDLCCLFGRVCDMLEQPGNTGNYRKIFSENYFVTAGIPDDAKIRLIEERGDLYCSVNNKLTEKEKWRVAQCVRVLTSLINYWKPEK